MVARTRTTHEKAETETGPFGPFLADAHFIPSWLGREEAYDASGDAFSVRAHRSIPSADARSLRQRFDINIARAGLTDWVDVHEGTAASVAACWTRPIDMLFVDGDQSPEGARLAYDVWEPFLKAGGTIALHNSTERLYAPGHDGIHLLAVHLVCPPRYGEVRSVETTTFARELY